MGRMDEECISSTSFAILVNGSPSCPFKALRGQGDPLFPLLFNVSEVAMGAFLLKVKDIVFIGGFHVGQNGKSVTHL